jgi:hypothetical protein
VSAGRKHGTSGTKLENLHLEWTFSEAAVLFVRHCGGGKELHGKALDRTRFLVSANWRQRKP